ncbi:P-loop containing nucleoside triphosphate hydrolase protein [Pavlovales sp. CCMP2436]|nr:P-loop containing nucleoside triphosphate hydrolase protein [Pavlovales sp. CCMP2436]
MGAVARCARPRWLSGGGVAGKLELTRNFGIIAHIDAGKTTTTERLLLCAGAIRRAGDVDKGSTVTDFLEEERERGITIQSAAVSLGWRGYALNLIDTPGHVDFTIEVERALRVLDGVVLVIDAVAGVQAQTETVWRQARTQGLPAIAFINKLDRDGASFDRALGSLQTRLGVRPLALQLPLGEGAERVVDLVQMRALEWVPGPLPVGRSKQTRPNPPVLCEWPLAEAPFATPELLARATARRLALTEAVAELDDEFAEAYLGADEPAAIVAELLGAALRRVTLSGSAVPALCGSALRSMGLEPLLDAAVALLPAPTDRPTPTLRVAGAAPDAPPAPTLQAPAGVALAFKVVHDFKRRPIVFARVYSGELRAKGALVNSSAGVLERPSGIFRIEGDRYEPLEVVHTGEIVAFAGLKQTATGDTLLCASGGFGAGLALPNADAHALDPVFFVALEADSASQHAALDAALSCLTLEDPSLHVRASRETGQLLLAGMGELHLEVAASRLRRDFDVPVRVGRMRVAYRETACVAEPLEHSLFTERALAGKSLDATHAYCSPTAAAAAAADLAAPLEERLKRQDREALLSGLEDGLAAGPLAGFPAMGVRAELLEAIFEPGVPPLALRLAAAEAAAEAFARAAPALLEPVMNAEIVTPQSYVGSVLSDLTSNRRAAVLSVTVDEGGAPELALQRVSALVPLGELVGYATTLRSLTRGEGGLSLEFVHYGRLDGTAERAVLLDARGY